MKIRASKCNIKQVPVTEQKTFLKDNHIQGYVPSSVCIGLYLSERLVYLMSFGTVRRRNISYATWDLKRMCGLKDSVIYGGASKLLKYFVSNYDIGKGIVTYCDTEVFDGHTYPTIGFKYHHTNPKDYRYVKDGKTYNKQYGQKACIYRRHPEWKDLDMTERQMMEMDGFKREYHKGLVAYTYGCNPEYQIYKIEFTDGSTYIGQHTAYGADDYITSSTYYKQGHEVKTKTVIFKASSREQMDFMETVCIMEDKALSKNNVNGNLGAWAMRVTYCFDRSKQSKSLQEYWKTADKSRCRCMSDVTTKKVKCLETGEVHTKSEWAELGYHKAYDCARRTRYTCKGYHFSFESDDTTLQELGLWEQESRQNQELIRRHKISLFNTAKAYAAGNNPTAQLDGLSTTNVP